MSIALYPWLTETWQRFVKARQANKVPHAVLLAGHQGLGKLSLAESMVASLLCLDNNEDMSACGQCHSCQLLAAGTHPDHTLLAPEEAGKQIKIDQIRELKEKQTLKSKVAVWKTVVITAADQLNISAFNSLLKLLEEPQDNTVLILISEQHHQLPITIRSRCQTMAINAPVIEQALAWLKQQTENNDEAELKRQLTLSQGSPLLALAYLQAGQQDTQQIEQDLNHLLTGQANPVQLTAAWLQLDPLVLFHYLQTLIQDKLKRAVIQKNISDAELVTLWGISDCILNTIKLISSSNNLNKTLLIEDFMVSVTSMMSANTDLLRANR